MNRKVAVLWLSLIMIFSFIVIIIEMPELVSAQTIFVDDSYGSEDATHKKTIQAGVDNATFGDTVYVFNGTYYENVVVNKTINLTGENKDTTIIDGSGGGYVVLIQTDWVNITGFTISNGGEGINIWSYSYNNITNNIFTLNDGGLRFIESSNNSIMYNYFSDHMNYPMAFSSSSNNTIVNNYLSSTNNRGIYFISSENNNFTNNTFLNNGIFIRGETLSHFNSHTIPSSNTVNGKPILYYKDNIGINIDGIQVGQLILANCTDFTVKNLHINNTYVAIELGYSSNINIIQNSLISNIGDGIYLYSSSYNKILNNNISNNQDGIYLRQLSNNNTIMNNDIFSNGDGIFLRSCYGNKINNNNAIDNTQGIELWWSSNNTIIGNLVSLNLFSGIYLSWASLNNTINGNIGSDNEHGIRLRSSSHNNTIVGNKMYEGIYGIAIEQSDNNKIIANNASNNFRGIIVGTANNEIIGNDVMWNLFSGIEVYSSNNKIYHNNIVGNSPQAIDVTNNNNWDNGYPSGGNYWSDFDESGEGAYDDYQGSDQDIPGSDGIVDNGTGAGGGINPYVIDSDSQDNYPLIEPIENYNYLSEGWNLISIPLIQSDTNVGTVLTSMTGSYTAVQWYNVTDTNDHWKHNSTQKPPNLNDLDDINHTMGFWIYIFAPGGVLFEYSGTRPTVNQSIPLFPGWNLVGYPSLNKKNRTTALNNLKFDLDVDMIQTFDVVTKTWEEIGPSDDFEIGRGYWIHSKVLKTWIVPL